MGSMTLADIRKKYPQTNGLSDEDVISVIAQRYGASIEDTKTILNYEPPAPRSRTWGEVAGDTLVTAAKSAVGLPQSIAGLIDIPTGGRVGKALEEAGYRPNEAQDMLSGMYSDPQKAANQRVADAQGFTDTAIAYAQNPSTIATTIGESAGQMLGGAGAARKLVSLFPKLAPWAAGALGEGLMGAGSAESQLRAESEDGLTTAKQGLSALASGAGVAAFGALGGRISSSKLGQKVGLADIDTMLAGGGTAPKTTVGFLKSAMASGISEGALEEMPQSAWEQMMQNYAQDKPILDGVGKAMASGLVAGVAMGGAGGGYNAMVSKVEPPADIMDQTDIDSVINAAENSIEQLPLAQREATPIDDPMRLEIINQLPEALRDAATRAYNIIIDDEAPKGIKKQNQKLLDDILAQAASEMQPIETAPIDPPAIEQPKPLEPFEQVKQLQSKVSDLEANNPFEQDHMDSLNELQTAVTNYTASKLESGEMPVFTSGELTIIVTPSAKQEGLFQVTRYSKNGAIGDSEYTSIEKAVESEGLQYNTPLSGKEAVAAITQANEAEGNFQSRLAEQKLKESNRVLADIESTDSRVSFEQEKSRVNQRNAIIDSILASDAAVDMRPAQIADMVKSSMAEQGYANPVLSDSEFNRIKRFNDIAKAEPVAETIDETNLEGQAPSSNLSDLVPERKVNANQTNVIATKLPADLISVAEESKTKQEFWKALTARKIPLGPERNALMAAYKELKAQPVTPTATPATQATETTATAIPNAASSVTPTEIPNTVTSVTPTEIPNSQSSISTTAIPKTDIASSTTSITPTAIPTSATSIAPTEIPSSASTVTATAIPETTLKPDGNLSIKGNTKELQTQLKEAGIPSLPSKDGVTVGAKNVEKAQEFIASIVPVENDTTADSKIEVYEGKGLIKGKYLSSVDGETTPNGPFNTEIEAREAALNWTASKEKALQESSNERERKDSYVTSLSNGESLNKAQIESLNLRGDFSDMRWFIGAAADLFKVPSRQIRPYVNDLIRKSYNDMGTERELVPTNTALKAIAQKIKLSNPAQQTTQQKGMALPYKKGKTGAETARNKLAYENPFLSFLATHGVSIQDRSDVGGDKKRGKLIPGHGPLFRKNAPRLDELAQLALEKGFITQAQMDSDTDNGGVNALSEMINSAVRNEVVTTVKDVAANRDVDEELKQEASNLGIDISGKSSDEVYDLVKEHYDEKAYQEAIDMLNELNDDEKIASQEYNLQELMFDIERDSNAEKDNAEGAGDSGITNTGTQSEAQGGSASTPETNTEQAQTSDAGGGNESFRLTGETAQEARERIAQEEREVQARTEDEARLAEIERTRTFEREVTDRQDVSADNFSLSSQVNDKAKQKQADAKTVKDQLAGQADIFSSKPNEAAKEQIHESDLTPAEKLANIAAVNRGDVSPDDVAKALGTPKNDRNSISIEIVNKNGDYETLTYSKGDYVLAGLGSVGKNRSTEFLAQGEIEGISKAKQEVKVGGQWYDIAGIRHAEKPQEIPVNKTALSSVVDSVNKKNGEDLDESDAVINTNIMTIEDHQNVMKLARAGKIKVQDIKAAYFSLKENEEQIKQGLSAKKKDDLLKAGGYNFAANHKSDNKDQIVRSLFSDMMDDFAYFSSDSLSYGFGAGQRVKAIDDRIAGLTQESLDKYAEKQKKKDEEAKAWMDERLEKMKAQEAGAKNPVTLADFQTNLRAKMADGKTFAEARMMLTQEQRAQFDNLAAESTRTERAKNKVVAQEQTMRAPGEALTAGETIKTKHTKHGHDLWQFNLDQRVSKEEYQQLSNQARKLGGDYSSYRGNGAIPGWQFRTPEAAQAFKDLIAGDNSAAKEVMAARRDAFADDRSQSASERLNEMAGALESDSEDQLNRDRKTNTTRRAGMASRAEANARAGIAFANTMRNIANFIDKGKAKFLDKVREKKQVSLLTSAVEVAQYDQQKAQGLSYAEMEKQKGMPANQETADFAAFPSYTAYRSDLANLARQLLEVEGTKLFGKKLLDLADDTSDAYLAFAKANLNKVMTFSKKDGGLAAFTSKAAAENAITRSGYRGQAIAFMVKRGEYTIILSPSAAIKTGVWSGDGDKRITLSRDFGTELVEKIGRAARRGNKVSVPWQFESTYDKFKTLSRMNIETAAEYRAALREFISLREQPKEANKVKELERSMIGRQNDGMDFFPTPIATADEMVQVAEIKPGMKVLEPSAGWGHIAERIRESGVEPDVVELSGKRRELLEAKGFNLVGSDFLEVSKGEGYDRILMNPPFSDRRDAEHVQHAYSLLKPGGRLVAIMGEGVFFGKDKSAQEFRDWVESVGGTDEKLAEGTFLDPSLPVNTSVSARMVVIDKADNVYSKSKSNEANTDNGLGDVKIVPAVIVEKNVKSILAEEGAVQVNVSGGNVDVLKQIAERFGKKIVFFREVETDRLQNKGVGLSTGSTQSKSATNEGSDSTQGENGSDEVTNGFVTPRQPKLVFLNVDGANHLTYILGHELGHSLKIDDPKLWAEMTVQLQPLVRKFGKYRAEYGQGLTNDVDVLEELVSDVIGDNFLNNAFWQDMAKQSQSLFKRIADKAIALLNKSIRLMVGRDVSIFISDMEKARSIIAETMLKYVDGVSKGRYEAILNDASSAQKQLPATIEIDGVERPTTNSNGKPLAATEEGVKNFWRWFGDSKVVDANGNPMVVYHGTTYREITEFLPEGGNKEEGKKVLDLFRNAKANDSRFGYMMFRSGSFFSSMPKYAENYTGENTGMMYPVYIKAQNPIFKEMSKAGTVTGTNPSKTPDALILTGENGVFNEIAIIDPTQIKSATGNNGKFDGGNSDIRYSKSTTSKANLHSWDSPEETKFDDFLYKYQDKHIDTKRVVDAIDKNIADDLNVTEKEELYHNKAASRNKEFINNELRPLIDSMREMNIDIPTLDEYLHARTAEESNDLAKWRNPTKAELDKRRDSAKSKIDNLKSNLAVKEYLGLKQDLKIAQLQDEINAQSSNQSQLKLVGQKTSSIKTKIAALQKANKEISLYVAAEQSLSSIDKITPFTGDNTWLSGMKTADARKYLASLSPVQRKNLEVVASKVDAILEGTRQMYVDYGLESKSTIDGWRDMFDHYVPLMREQDGDTQGMGVGQGFSVKGKEVKGRTGSTRKVVDIFANIAMQREKVIVRGEKNKVAKSLLELASANPNPEFWSVGKPETKRVYNPDTDSVVEQADPLFKSRENVVVAKVTDSKGNIVEKAVIFNESNPRALRMSQALKNLDTQQMNGFMGGMATVTRYFSAINTQYNPIFGVVNLVRDFQGALINLSSTALSGHKAEVAKHTLSALKAIYLDERAGKKGGANNSDMAKLWREFELEGGPTGYRDMFANSEDRAKAIEKELNPTKWMDSPLGKVFTANGMLKVPMAHAYKQASGLFGVLSDYNTAMENSVRLAAYKVAKDQGMSNQKAASLAKNLTVNFNRKGQVAQQVGALYAFFNASMQGSARLSQTLFTIDKGDIKTARLSSTGKKIVYGGVLLGVVQALMLSAAGLEEDEPPEFVRERSLIIPTGWTGLTDEKAYINIPMPLGLHVIPNLGRIPTEFALNGFKNPTEKVIGLMGLVAGAFNPTGGGVSLLQAISPTAIDPIAALSENKDWTGKPIAKESYNRALPGHALTRDTASFVSKMLSEGINYVSGGTEYKKGVLSPTPDQIDYLFGQVFGGVGREALKTQQSISATMTGEDLPIYKVPLVGRFYGNAESQSSQANRFYANVDLLNEHETEIKGMREDRKGLELARYMRENPEARMFEAANKVEREIQQLRKVKRDLLKADAEPARIKMIENQIKMKMTRFNESFASVRKSLE